MECKEQIIFLENKIKELENTVNRYKYDSLTGLLGLTDFDERFNEYWHEYTYHNSEFILIMIDINGLHEINRTKSFTEGNKLILEVSSELTKKLSDCIVFRIGGDEFTVLRKGNKENLLELVDKVDKIENIEYGISFSGDFNSPSKMFNSVDKQIISKKEQYDSRNENTNKHSI